MVEAVVQPYNPAQIRVLKRLNELRTEEDPTTNDDAL